MMRLRAPGSLRGKLLATQALVILAGSVTLALVALALAPRLYHSHVERAVGTVPEALASHLDAAFAEAMLTALAVAVAAAVLTALTVSWWSARRIAAPLHAAAEAARRLAAGAHQARVPDPGTSDELGVLARAFNDMADTLAAVERRRRSLLADLAHELRTPLATIEGYTEGLADGVVPADAATWEVLRAASGRLHRLADDIAAVSDAEERSHGLQLARRRPETLVHAAVAAAQPHYGTKGVRLDIRTGGRLPQVAVDADRIGEVLDNLLDNALRHTPAGGRVEVAAARRDEEVELTVTDSGEGIPPEALPHVFERFYRADPARPHGGSGIGLTIARALVQAHGGRIEASSPGPGHGARVAVLLPSASTADA
jgi:signal transduction histidine kinase